MSLLRDWSSMIHRVPQRTTNSDLGLGCLQLDLWSRTVWLSHSILHGQTCPDWVAAGRKGERHSDGTMSTPFGSLVAVDCAKFSHPYVSLLNGLALS